MRAIAASARRQSVSEAEVIRQAVAVAVAAEDLPPHDALFSSDVLLADDVDVITVSAHNRPDVAASAPGR